MTQAASDILTQLGQLLSAEEFTQFHPAVSATVQDMMQNQTAWTDPSTAAIKGAAAVATIVSGATPLQATAIAGIAQLVATLWHLVVENRAPTPVIQVNTPAPHPDQATAPTNTGILAGVQAVAQPVYSPLTISGSHM